jgi:sulfite exporter TauE/SafE
MLAASGTRNGSRPSPRDLLRVNAYAAIGLGVAALFLAEQIARALGLHGAFLPAVAGVAIILFGIDALGFSVGRRLRKLHMLPFVAADVAACIAAVIVLIAADPLSSPGRAVVVLAALSFGWFAYAELRAMRSL